MWSLNSKVTEGFYIEDFMDFTENKMCKCKCGTIKEMQVNLLVIVELKMSFITIKT